ncbi:predicted protein [Naegleria gruberi]|uniref:Predicted protein n=1 Tax=Naegleria gruberi TaxID=5762 RepID=D2V095_NAEGR|nr:uncharacterized protein NAEGRDRAFT_78016 [Naegleria gruberi]EFC49489.1 predicted protein [Naegleria gruberi]|eukprot:XP_002682233.1 predicted protein [Naegleria gruberi strain NEG-M]
MVNEKQTDNHHDSEKDHKLIYQHHHHVAFNINPPTEDEKNNQANSTTIDDHSSENNLLPKMLLLQHNHHHLHHHLEEHMSTDATDVTSTDDFTESTVNGHSHDESAQDVAMHRIEQVAERFANVTKKKSKKALKLLTESPFNIFKEIMDEEEEQSSGEEDLENNIPKTVSHSRTQSIESLPKEEIIEENGVTINQTIPNAVGDSKEQNPESKALDESTHLKILFFQIMSPKYL